MNHDKELPPSRIGVGFSFLALVPGLLTLGVFLLTMSVAWAAVTAGITLGIAGLIILAVELEW